MTRGIVTQLQVVPEQLVVPLHGAEPGIRQEISQFADSWLTQANPIDLQCITTAVSLHCLRDLFDRHRTIPC
jgi:hypothetical protein